MCTTNIYDKKITPVTIFTAMAERRDSKSKFTDIKLIKEETLGVGSYGAVCKAKCDQLLCAAKLLHPTLFQRQAQDPGKKHKDPVTRFEEECHFLSGINHPNIVQYLGTVRDPETNNPVLLMELMDESLTHFLESSPGDLPYHTQVNISHDIAQALAFLHSNGIIHRDLSSNNVLLLASTRAKVTDFGMFKFIARDASQQATMTIYPGNPLYMSPEARSDQAKYTEKLDIFSFGVLLIQITTRLFPDPTDQFKTRKLVDPEFPDQFVEAKVPVPEVERRQAHIDLISLDHPLLPTALHCLNDKEADRPTATQLCQTLDEQKKIAMYQESSQKHPPQERRTSKENCAGAQTIEQRDRELSELRQELARRNEQVLVPRMHQVALQDKKNVTVRDWDSLPDIPAGMWYGSSAVIGDKVYVMSYNSYYTVCEFSNNTWKKLPYCPHMYCTIANTDNKLTTVGGGGVRIFSNALYTYVNDKWVTRYPPMPTERWKPGVASSNNKLVVAGGKTKSWIGFQYNLNTVEILDIQNRQWSIVSSLPVEMYYPSATICGGDVYIHPRTENQEKKSVYKCSLEQLVQSQPSSAIWENITSLPVSCSSLATVNGHLLAVGGDKAYKEYTINIYQYIDASWAVVGQMKAARSVPATAVLPGNKLMVVGGYGAHSECEQATIT